MFIPVEPLVVTQFNGDCSLKDRVVIFPISFGLTVTENRNAFSGSYWLGSQESSDPKHIPNPPWPSKVQEWSPLFLDALVAVMQVVSRMVSNFTCNDVLCATADP